MKMKLILSFLLLGLAGSLKARESMSWAVAVDDKNRTVIQKSANEANIKMTVSSTTATLASAANLSRNALNILNSTGFGAIVYRSTWAATSVTSNYVRPIADGAEWVDSSMPYTGAQYILAAPGISSATVIVSEKW